MESRGEAIPWSGECEIQSGVVVSERLNSFTIQFDVPDEIRLEFRDILCAEQMYDPEKNTLRADVRVSPQNTKRERWKTNSVDRLGDEGASTHMSNASLRNSRLSASDRTS